MAWLEGMGLLLLAMSAILLTWTALAALYTGIGLLARRAFGLTELTAADLVLAFWVGWALALVALQLWHLALPANGWFLAALGPPATAGLAGNAAQLRRLARLARGHKLLLLGLLLSAAWLANRALGHSWNWDTYYYHLPTVRWLSAYPIVPGLGNLFSLLAYNSTQFLYAASLNSGPWAGKVRHVANGLLLLPLYAQALLAVHELLRRRVTLDALYFALAGGALVWQGIGPNVSSASPDLPVFLLQVLLCGRYLRLLERPEPDRTARGYELFCIVLLACIGCTVKLSFCVLGGSVALLSLLAARWHRQPGEPGIGRKSWTWIAAATALTLGPWLLRGVLTSGYLAYPSPAPSVPVEWRMPQRWIAEDLTWIQSWSRQPWKPSAKVLRDWGWVDAWSRTIIRYHYFDLIVPLLLAGLGMLLAAAHSLRPGRPLPRLDAGTWPLLLACAAAIGLWFVNAPDPRLAGASFWILMAASLALALRRLEAAEHDESALLLIWLYLVLLSTLLVERAATSTLLGLSLAYLLLSLLLRRALGTVTSLLRPASLVALLLTAVLCTAVLGRYRQDSVYGAPAARRLLMPQPRNPNFKEYKTRWGLTVYVPKKGSTCWDAPLPCTQRPRPDLRLRQPGQLDAGFVVDTAAAAQP